MNSARPLDAVCRCGNPIPPFSPSQKCLGCDLSEMKAPLLAACSTCDRLLPKVDAAEGVLSIECRHDGTFVLREV